MPLRLYASLRASGSLPDDWRPVREGVIKYPVRNDQVRRYLQQLLPGVWRKVIKKGHAGEVHYFEHRSGQVAGVKFYPGKASADHG